MQSGAGASGKPVYSEREFRVLEKSQQALRDAKKVGALGTASAALSKACCVTCRVGQFGAWRGRLAHRRSPQSLCGAPTCAWQG